MRGRRSRSRGYRAERELVNELWRLGFAVMRAPASGAKIKKADYPDIVAIREGKVAVFEVKSRAKTQTIYLEKEQVHKLLNFTERAGGKAYIAIRIPHKEWKFIRAENLQETKGGKLKVTKQQIIDAPNLAGVLKDLRLIKSLEEYMGDGV